MRTAQLLEDFQFRDDVPYAQPLYVDANGRVLRFMLKPGQTIREHEAAHSPFYVVMLKGRAVFSDGEGREHEVGPGSLLIFEPGERHIVRALNEDAVFVGFLHGAPGTRPEHVGGDLARVQD